MGGLCCCKVEPQSVDQDEPENDSRNLIGLSYSQLSYQKFKGYCEVAERRLLAFTNDRVFAASRWDEVFTSPLTCVHYSPPALGKIIYGSFIDDHRPGPFLTVSHCQEKYLVRTYTLSEETMGCEVRKTIWKRIKKHHPFLAHHLSILRRQSNEGQDFSSYSLTSHASGHPDPNYDTKLQEEQEISAFENLQVTFIRTLKNIACGQTELLLATDSEIVTVTLKQHSILLLNTQRTNKRILSIEYWSGYYFILYATNYIGIYKRNISGLLKEVTAVNGYMKESSEIVIQELQVPALEWSDRLINALSKELPTHVLLVGMKLDESQGRSCLIKYNIHKSERSAMMVMGRNEKITSINYGPYDNGPVILGMDSGYLIGLDYYSFSFLFRTCISRREVIKWITYDPCNELIVGTYKSIHTCSLTERERDHPDNNEDITLIEVI